MNDFNVKHVFKCYLLVHTNDKFDNSSTNA